MAQVKLDQIIDPKKALPAEKEEANALIAIDTSNLNAESLDILNQIIAAEDVNKTKDLTYLFNINQNKKTMVRLNTLSSLQDRLVDLFSKRITERPDEISNQEVMQALKIVQDILERGQKQVSNEPEKPLIQINTQTNNIGTELDGLSRESRNKAKNAVMSILNSIKEAEARQDQEVIDVDETTSLEDSEEDD